MGRISEFRGGHCDFGCDIDTCLVRTFGGFAQFGTGVGLYIHFAADVYGWLGRN